MGFSKEQEQVFSEAHPEPHQGLIPRPLRTGVGWQSSLAQTNSDLLQGPSAKAELAERRPHIHKRAQPEEKHTLQIFVVFAFNLHPSVPLFPTFLKLTGSFHKVIIYHISCQLCLKLRLLLFKASLFSLPMESHNSSLQWIPKEKKLPLNNPIKFSHY